MRVAKQPELGECVVGVRMFQVRHAADCAEVTREVTVVEVMKYACT